ncbi:hypothetical protein D3C75_1240900 [compost metagenome]
MAAATFSGCWPNSSNTGFRFHSASAASSASPQASHKPFCASRVAPSMSLAPLRIATKVPTAAITPRQKIDTNE